MTSTKARPRSRRGEGGLLREDILAAASDLLLRLQDADAVTIRAVASSVGVSAPSVYLHFPDKGSLIFAVCEQLFTDLDTHIQAAVGRIEDPFEQLRRRALAYVRFGIEHPEEYRVLFMSRPSDVPDTFDTGRLLSSASFVHLYENVEGVLATGELRDELDPYGLALELWAVVHGHTSLRIGHPGLDWPDVEETMANACADLVDGLRRH